MGKVISSATMSIDGYIALPDNNIGPLFDWYDAGTIEVATADPKFKFHLTQESKDYWESWVPNVGAIVCGRALFDFVDGWGGAHPIGAPVVVLTHNPPTDWKHDKGNTYFVSDGIKAAIDKAQEIAGDKIVSVTAGEIASQCLDEGLLDEVSIDLAPVVLGRGKPYFNNVHS